jgi:hypothetical protein
MSAQSTEQPIEGHGCSACGQDVENEPLVEQPDGSWKHPMCAEPEVVQPADVVDEETVGKVVAIQTKRGSLTLRPDQSELDPNQHAALVAIGIDFKTDPGIIPHARAFIHMCQIRQLDPWAREAYLIGRGQGDKRKYTMQTGIDGYRKMSGATKRFIRVKKTLWTGQDDDDRSFVRVTDEDGDVVMQRVWFDQWPASRGYPGAAKVVIEHYDERGDITTTAAVADWAMYAPFTDEWEWHPSQRGKKVYKTNPDGSRVQKLNDMWAKGYAHMLAKCAEALAHRKAFPAATSGFYVAEEMHRADQIEDDRMARERAQRRRTAMERQRMQSAPAVEQGSAPEPAGAAPSEPVPVADVVAEVVEQTRADAPHEPQDAPESAQDSAPSTAPADAPDAPGERAAVAPEERAGLLRAELAWQADTLGHSVTKLAQRQVRALRRNVEDFTAEELLTLVAGLRPVVVARLGHADREAANRYAAVTRDEAVRLDDILGVAEGEIMPEDDPRLDADPESEHEPVMVDGACEVCGRFEDEAPHPQAN